MSATESKGQPLPFAVAGVSMRDLLAAGEAAALISTPPRAPEPGFAEPVGPVEPVADHREAA
ncbi:hypothetical protein [Streptomyces azureus]|uniref:Uncharacterized protein n=1 Tax=Streptomyces azureus TaxID=146537 RepID=A0A0K8Q0S8_STRAJ|nr:hypothetical protein [Streptomyces azureus]GAP53349.1 predicted protein [Streptomyces azureus]